jgi:signal transduction histidine kinase
VDERNYVFERFYRILRSNSVADGSGLGLSIVDEVARSHKAAVEIRDGSSGTGTIVEVTFPPREKLAIAIAAERDIRRHLGS